MMTEPEKYLGRDPYTYSRDKERFQKDLFQFHSSRGTPFFGLPTVSGKPVDLYLLYSLVTKYGGFHKVSDKNIWSFIQPKNFHFPDSCSNAELALKQIYMRYLYAYERVYIHGDDPDMPDDDESMSSRGGKSGGRILVHQVPMRYDFKQHKLRPDSRLHHGLSTGFAFPNCYERLEKSLISGLPNEVDFAINVCCILSMEGTDTLRLLSHRRLIDILLANVGLFSESSDLVNLYHQEWLPRSKRNFTQFWYESVEADAVVYGDTLLDMISWHGHRQLDQELYINKMEKTGKDVLHLGRDNVDKDMVLYRVQQVVNIIRNLSFDASNAQALADSQLAIKFALLCCHSSLPQIKRDGMDLIVNLSHKYSMPQASEFNSQLIIKCIHSWINSEDKLEIVSALLVLSALAQVESNEDTLIESLDESVYEKIVSLARIYDLQLIISALDSLYFLSEIGETSCESIASVSHCIDFLVDLVTVETQSFGEAALGGIKVTDRGLNRLPPVHQHPSLHRKTLMGPPATPNPTQPVSRPLTPGQQAPLAQHTARPPTSGQHQNLVPNPVSSQPAQTHSMPYRPIMPKPQPGGLVSQKTPLLPATPQNLAMMVPEQVACNWLRANYEPYPGALVSTPKVHQEYTTWLHRRAGQSAVPVTPGAFVNCVKRVFPYSELVVDGPESQISGVRWKPPPSSAGNVAPSSCSQPPPYSQHMMQTGVVAGSLPTQRVTSPNSSGSSDMLRNMLLNSPSPSHQRARSNSGTSIGTPSTRGRRNSSGGRRGGSRSSSPRAPSAEPPISNAVSIAPTLSPASSMELQVCGNAEKVEDVANSGSLVARIERVENSRSMTFSPASYGHETPKSSSIPPSDLKDNQKSQSNNGDDLNASSEYKKLEDNGVASDNAVSGKTVSRELDNGQVTPNSEKLSSPVLCNGNHSDTDSFIKEAPKYKENCKNAMNGGDENNYPDKPIPPHHKNGYINGLEKMLENIVDNKELNDDPKSRRHHIERSERHDRHISDDSMESQSSNKTELSSQSPNHMHATVETSRPPNSTPSMNDNNLHSLPAGHAHSIDGKSIPPDGNTLPKSDSFNNPNIKSGSQEDPYSVSSNLSSPTSSHSSSYPGYLHNNRPSLKRKRSQSPPPADDKYDENNSTRLHKCLWRDCTTSYSTCSLLRRHVSSTHTIQSGPCLWTGCDGLERKRWALVSHVSERHVNDAALAKALSNREKGVLPAQPSTSTPPSGSAIYTPQAAKMAILRNTSKPPYQDLLDPREGPVTKHIRFTSGLILRNLSRYSPTGRKLLKKHESHLAYIAGSTMEASAAIVNCLWEIQLAQQLSPPAQN